MGNVSNHPKSEKRGLTFSLSEVLRRLRIMRGQKRIVLAGGTFDILHVGHLRYLEECKKQGDILVVCVAGDARTRRRKGPDRPIIPAIQRAEIVANLKMVDFVFISNSKPFSESILRSVNPNVLVTSSNEPSREMKQEFQKYMHQRHPKIELVLTHRFNTTSTSSRIIKKIRAMR